MFYTLPQTIETLINKLYWSNDSKRYESTTRNIKKWFSQCDHNDRKFDCGYLEIDINLLSLLLNFVPLLNFCYVTY